MLGTIGQNDTQWVKPVGKIYKMFVAFILYLYVFFVSWTGAFSLGAWFPLHVVLLLTAVTLYLPRFVIDCRKIPKNIYCSEDIFIFIGLIAILMSSLLHLNEKTINYLMAYFYIFGIGYFALKLLLSKFISTEKLFVVNTVGVLFVAAFASFDMLSSLFVNFDIQEYIPRLKPTTATYNVIFRRSYGFATEPTILGYYFNTLGPLAMWQLWKPKSVSRIIKYCLSAIIVFGWLCTFSAACIAFMIVSILIVLVIKFLNTIIAKRKVLSKRTSLSNTSSEQALQTLALQPCDTVAGNNKMLWNVTVFLAVTSFVLFCTIKYIEPIKGNVSPMITKVTLKGSHSAYDRVWRWETSLESISSNPLLGMGQGYLSSIQRGSSTNWYLFLAVESGLAGIIPFIVFLLLSLRRILKSEVKAKYWFLVGFIAAVMHLNVISTIHHPFLWLLLAIFHVVQEKDRKAHVVRENAKN